MYVSKELTVDDIHSFFYFKYTVKLYVLTFNEVNFYMRIVRTEQLLSVKEQLWTVYSSNFIQNRYFQGGMN